MCIVYVYACTDGCRFIYIIVCEVMHEEKKALSIHDLGKLWNKLSVWMKDE